MSLSNVTHQPNKSEFSSHEYPSQKSPFYQLKKGASGGIFCPCWVEACCDCILIFGLCIRCKCRETELFDEYCVDMKEQLSCKRNRCCSLSGRI